MWETDLSGGAALVFGAEGKGLRPLVRRTLRRARLDPARGAVESLNVSVAAALLLYEARRQRGVADATPLPLRRLQPPARRRRSPIGASSSTRSRASSRREGRAASSSSTAPARTTSSGRSTVRFAPDADTLLERLAAEHRDRERVLLVSSRLDRARHGRASRLRSSRRRPSSASSSRPRDRERRPAVSPTSSTPRRGRGSSGSGEASNQPRSTASSDLCSWRTLARFTST